MKRAEKSARLLLQFFKPYCSDYTLCISECVIEYTQRVRYRSDFMDKAIKIKELRERTGMNRREFCEYFQIPYRTVTEWERDGLHAPDYVIRGNGSH